MWYIVIIISFPCYYVFVSCLFLWGFGKVFSKLALCDCRLFWLCGLSPFFYCRHLPLSFHLLLIVLFVIFPFYVFIYRLLSAILRLCRFPFYIFLLQTPFILPLFSFFLGMKLKENRGFYSISITESDEKLHQLHCSIWTLLVSEFPCLT